MSADGRKQAWAELAGVSNTGTYNDTFMFFAATKGWTGTFNDRMIQYLRSILGAAPDFEISLPDLQLVVAQVLNHSTWEEVGYDIGLLSGPTYGPEAINNGTFDTDIAGWVEFFTGTESWDAGRLKLLAGTGNPRGVYQGALNFTLTAGTQIEFSADYEVLGWDITRDLLFQLGGANGFNLALTLSSSNESGHVQQAFTVGADSTTFTVTDNGGPGGYTLWLDNVSIRSYTLL